jgi:isoprenylcysteine carboxyl methyltransferase (ICMT) family protein YpbQ
MNRYQNPKKNLKTAPNGGGIEFGNRETVQFKITHKDLVLVAGILVALIIALTTWMRNPQSQSESQRLFPTPKVSEMVLQKIGKTIVSKF